MQAAPVRSSRPSVTAALRAVEALLLNGGQRTARRNAWTCVLEDRRRAEDRIEVQRMLDRLGAGDALDGLGTAGGTGPRATGAAGVTARTS
uniref:SCO2195 family GlnR-regulated protein n=1 Tax=Streptomyces odontomachi TaxID=2944940 RepID=UPI00210DE9DF|nr:hypothetical protein [Streptomyces sp. ODS25]